MQQGNPLPTLSLPSMQQNFQEAQTKSTHLEKKTHYKISSFSICFDKLFVVSKYGGEERRRRSVRGGDNRGAGTVHHADKGRVSDSGSFGVSAAAAEEEADVVGSEE